MKKNKKDIRFFLDKMETNEIYKIGKDILRDNLRLAGPSVDEPSVEPRFYGALLKAGNMHLYLCDVGRGEDAVSEFNDEIVGIEKLVLSKHLVADGAGSSNNASFYWQSVAQNS